MHKNLSLFVRKSSILLYYSLLFQLFLHTSTASDTTNTGGAKQATHLECLSYLSYSAEDNGSGFDRNKLSVRRGYLTVKKEMTDFLHFRMTIDCFDGDKGAETRLKYIFADFRPADIGFITNPSIEFGIVHTPWLGFEESINNYRMQGYMFIEASRIVVSADFGTIASGLLGGKIDEEYQKTVSSKFPGRYGSFAIGIFNGGGYSEQEKNSNKTIQGRLTVRPLPDIIPGLQLSYSGIVGKGNTSEVKKPSPDWVTNSVFASYESQPFTLTAQVLSGKGNRLGDMADTSTGNQTDYFGYSFFGEARLGSIWVMGRYDKFHPDASCTCTSILQRIIVGIGYELYKGNIILLDLENVSNTNPTIPGTTILKLTTQIFFSTIL